MIRMPPERSHYFIAQKLSRCGARGLIWRRLQTPQRLWEEGVSM
jgi:hypothetical protein